MMTLRYIHHVTLQTAHVARQYRGDVSDDAVRVVSAMLDEMLSGRQPDVPGFPDFWLSGTQEGHTLVATIWTGMRADGRIPVLTSMTCLKSRAGPGAWRAIHDGATLPYNTDPTNPPSAPWTADRLEIGYFDIAAAAMARGERGLWTGDFARCLAWAWAERRKRSGTDD